MYNKTTIALLVDEFHGTRASSSSL